MPRTSLVVLLFLAVSLSNACHALESYEFDKSRPLVADANKLNSDAAALVTEGLDKYEKIFSEAQKADDPFEELGAQSDAFKKIEPQLESAKTKLHDASQKCDDASKLKLPDWYREYLSDLSELNKSGSETADLILQMVKNTYDPAITSEEDLDAKQKAVQDKLAVVSKHRDELNTAKAKLEADHKDDLK